MGFPSGLHRGLPSRHLTFIVSIGEATDVVTQSDPRRAPARYRFALSRLQATPALIAHKGYQEGVAIALTPLGCRAPLGVPARVLWDTHLEAEEVMGRAATELWERLQALIAISRPTSVACNQANYGVYGARKVWRAFARERGGGPLSGRAAQAPDGLALTPTRSCLFGPLQRRLGALADTLTSPAHRVSSGSQR